MAARKKSRKWIQAATERMARKGTLGSYGSGKSVKTMSRDVARGGKLGKKALFALNMKRAALRRARSGNSRRFVARRGVRGGRRALAARRFGRRQRRSFSRRA